MEIPGVYIPMAKSETNTLLSVGGAARGAQKVWMGHSSTWQAGRLRRGIQYNMNPCLFDMVS